jgi:cytoskeleton-associated protein 5
MDGQPPQEEDFSTLSIEDRLSHKNWKARVSAYETLVKTFQLTASETDPAFRPYISNPDLLKKIVTDSNVVAQEKGIECIIAFVKFAGENAARTRDAVVPALVDKCFGSTRAGTRNYAIELALQYVEVGNSGAGVVVRGYCQSYMPCFNRQLRSGKRTAWTCCKTTKNCCRDCGSIKGDCSVSRAFASRYPSLRMRNGIRRVSAEGCSRSSSCSPFRMAFYSQISPRLFGPQVTPPTPILKVLPKIFGHSDKTVRSEGTNLAHALYQYLGPGIEPWLADLKPVQVKELKEAWDGMEQEGRGKGSLKPDRMTRQQARDAEQNAASGDGDAEDDAAAEGASVI